MSTSSKSSQDFPGGGLYLSWVSGAALTLAGGLVGLAGLLKYWISSWLPAPWSVLAVFPLLLVSGGVLLQWGLILLSGMGPWSHRLYHRAAYKPVVRFFPVAMFMARLLGVDEMRLRRSFVALNNSHVEKLHLNLRPSEILLLMPHCLQWCECEVRVTGDVSLCKRCGRCPIGSLLGLSERSGIPLAVATGGTLARRIVKEKRSRAVVAVACERDLADGILDTYPLPAFGIVNARPFGPCFNTQVDLAQVEEAIRLLGDPLHVQLGP